MIHYYEKYICMYAIHTNNIRNGQYAGFFNQQKTSKNVFVKKCSLSNSVFVKLLKIWRIPDYVYRICTKKIMLKLSFRNNVKSLFLTFKKNHIGI